MDKPRWAQALEVLAKDGKCTLGVSIMPNPETGKAAVIIEMVDHPINQRIIQCMIESATPEEEAQTETKDKKIYFCAITTMDLANELSNTFNSMETLTPTLRPIH